MSKVCTICSKELDPVKNQNRYCSRVCTYKGFSIERKGTSNSPATQFKKGMIPWSKSQKGVRLSPESEFKKGQSPWNKGLKGYRAGALNNRWKGGITPFRTKVYHSEEYKLWRKSVFERDDYTCQKCNQRGCELNAHHVKPFADYPDLRLEVSNGLTVCKACHRAEHKGDMPNAKLTPFQVQRIRLMHEITPEKTFTSTGKVFGVDRTVISDLVKGKTWQNV